MANGGIIGPVNTPTADLATGVWELEEQYQAQVGGIWPPIPAIGLNSARFNSGSSDYLNRTPGSTSNRRTWTFSTWLKKSAISGANQKIFEGGVDGNSLTDVLFKTDESFRFYSEDAGITKINLVTNSLFRDPSAWYHIVVAVDTTQGTDTNRVKLYVNGVQETSLATATYPSQNLNTSVNEASSPHQVANGGGNLYFNGYLSEVCLIDGSQLAADSFGEFDEDSEIWKPIKVSGLTFGDNGSYLEYKQAGTSANASGMGADTSGNTNHFTVNNLTAVDQSIDTCTNNYCVMNPLDNLFSNATFSEGNLQYSSSRYASPTSTFGLTKGKWYFEIKCVSAAGTGGFVGITSATATATNFEFGNTGGGRAGYVYANNGGVYGNGGTLAGAGVFAEFGDDDNDLLMMAADLDNNKIYFGKNGTWGNSQNPVNGNNALTIVALSTQDSGVWRFGAMGETNNATIWQWNFGSPVHSIDSTQADDDGHGNFEYDVPAGYFALNSKNLAEYG